MIKERFFLIHRQSTYNPAYMEDQTCNQDKEIQGLQGDRAAAGQVSLDS